MVTNGKVFSVEPDALELSLFADASQGDRSALAILVEMSRNLFVYDCEVKEAEAVAMAEVFARLAVMHGDPHDKLRLADILCHRSNLVGRDHGERLVAEAIYWQRKAMEQGHPAAAPRLAALLAHRSDSGDELAGIELIRLLDNLTPECAAEVREQATEQAK